MKTNAVLKKVMKEWVEKIGPYEAMARLCKRGLGPTMVERLVAGTYDHEPRGANALALHEELAKDGLSLAGGGRPKAG